MDPHSKLAHSLAAGRFLILLSIAAKPASASTAPPPPRPGQALSGHVTTSTHQPLQATTVTLSKTDMQLHQVTHTDAAGAYSFPSLPPGQYLLLAFHPGFYPEFFNMAPQPRQPSMKSPNDGSPHGFLQGVEFRSGEPTPTADFILAPSPSITSLQDQAFASAYSPPQRQQLTFAAATFSPDHRYLALETTGVVSGDPEQVWRYDLFTRQLVAVTPAATQAGLQSIATVQWRDTLLHVTGITRMGGRLFNEDFPAHGAPSVAYTDQPFPYPQPEDPTASAGSYKLTAQRLHGGSTSWLARRNGKGPSHVIAAALLNTPVVNPALPYFFYVPVSYPTTFLDDQVAALDIRSGRQTIQRLPVSPEQLLAVAPDRDGFLLAYQVRGGCEPTPNENGEASEQINGFASTKPFEHKLARVCFVHLRRPE